jgi:hypothetical protein
MQALLHLDTAQPGSVDAAMAAAVCGHDRDTVVRLLSWNAHEETRWREIEDGALLEEDADLVEVCEAARHQAARMTALLRSALRLIVTQQASRYAREGADHG